jgi:hypothetical protein
MQQELCKRVTVAIVLGLLACGAAPTTVGVVPLGEVAPGLRGRGWSVFSGSEPESFDVEVLGVWANVTPETSYILTRLSGHGLEDTGVVAGMSGSPVYVEDRLLGAVAFSWNFASDAIAGVTPIESMRRLTDEPRSPVRAAGPPPEVTELLDGGTPRARLAAGLAVLRGGGPAGAGGLLWSAAGLGASARELLAEAVGPVHAGGSIDEPPRDLQPGDAVAAVLIDGDMRLAATGTVTDRVGDAVLAFGHPFLSMGDVVVPMAAAEIVTVVPSLAGSFKIGNVGPVVGQFDRDRPAGIRGTLGVTAPVLPLHIGVHGAVSRAYDLRLARVAPIAGPLVATSLLSALDAANGAGGLQELEMRARLDLVGRPPLEVRQVFDGPQASLGAAVHLLSLVGFLANNALADVDIATIDVEVERTTERRATRILRAHPTRRVVSPGEAIDLLVDLAPYSGDPMRHRMTLTVPRDAGEGPYILLVGDGTSLDAVRLQLEKFAPTRMSQALEFLNGLHSRSELGVLGVSGEVGMAASGTALPRLPGSIRRIWTAGDASGTSTLTTSIRQEQTEDLGVPLSGLVRVDLQVRARKSE